MRYFPSARRQRLVAACAVSAMALGAVAIPLAQADDHLKDKQKHVQQQLDAAANDLDESSKELVSTAQALQTAQAQLVDAKAALADVRTQLAAAEATDADLAAQLQTAEADLVTAQTQLGDGQAALETQRQVVADTVTSIYEQGDPRLLALSAYLDSATPADITRKMAATDAIVTRQTQAYDDLHTAEVALAAHEDQVSAAQQQVATQRAAAAAHLVTVQDLHERARVAKASVLDLVTSRRTAKKAAIAVRKSDRQELRDLKSEEAKIRERILAQAARQAARGKTKGGYTGDQGGFLMHPVVGPVTSPFGYRIHPIYGYWGLHDGTDFGVSCGEGLAAAATGTVNSEYYSTVYGNRLFLNVGVVNGKNLTVVYNHLSGYKAQVGDKVTRGDIVGYVGDTGWSTGCHLHFSVLVDGVPVDPMGWF